MTRMTRSAGLEMLKPILMRIFAIVLAFFTVTLAKAQPSVDIIQYINTYKQLAMEEMQRTGVPASIKLAQGIHETYAGKSDLVLKSNNHFGIKCKAEWTGQKVYHDDDSRGECFRRYTSPVDSYMDHSNFLKGSDRYSFLFRLDPTDYRGWATGLKKAGYATNPKYAPIIIKLIEDYNLQQYTLIAMGKLSPEDEVVAEVPKPATTTPDTELPIPVPVIPEEPSLEIPPPAASYPSGEFTINNTRVIFARQGSSFLSIAREYDIPLRRLFEFNDLKEQEILQKDQLLYLQRKRKTGSNEFHIMAKGETLYDVSQVEAIRLESLLEYNHLESYMEPAVGEKLYLHSKSASRPVLREEAVTFSKAPEPEAAVEAGTGNDSITSHTVQTGETLYSISKRYGVQMDKVKEWNKLGGYEVKLGQQLVIYKN